MRNPMRFLRGAFEKGRVLMMMMAAAAAAVTAGCRTAGTGAAATAAAAAPVRPVLLIGADGFSADEYREHKDELPNLSALAAQGAWTIEMRSCLPSASAINWKSILSGSPTEVHGYTTWGSKTPEIPPRVIGNYGQYPGIFGLIRDQKPDALTGCFHDWEGIKYLMEEKAISESAWLKDKGDEIVARTKTLLQKKPLFIFLHFDATDHAGHRFGWGSDKYREACRKVDGWVGQLVQAVRESPLAGEMVVMFCSDHGGINKNHGGKTLNELRTPFIMAGPGIKKGLEITDSTMDYDITATAALLMGIKQPQIWTGRPIRQGLE